MKNQKLSSLRRLERALQQTSSLPSFHPRSMTLRQAPLPCPRRLRFHATSGTSGISAFSSSGRAYSTASPVPASSLLFGQPVHETHPHLLAPGELTPGITAQEYHERRAKLLASLPANSAVLLPSAEIQYRSGAVFHAFRQETAFLYLTGFSEPESLALLVKTGVRPGDYLFHLWCRPKNSRLEQWHGPWSGLEAARDVWNADESHDIGRLEAGLQRVMKEWGVKLLFTDTELTKYGVPTKMGNIVQAAARGVGTSLLQPVLHPIRAIKSPAEIACMRKAGQLSGRALTNVMRRDWKTEKDLETFLEYEYKMSGLDGSAYIPVIAGGQRGSLIHYTLNNATLKPDEFVLVDAGGEYGTYITDITRTWPVNGKFSPAQKDLYEAVLDAQRTSVSLCRANAAISLDRLHSVTETAMRHNLRQLGFVLDDGGMDILFPHHVGHYIGLDVHDVPGYSRGVNLVKGHCVTVEPGIYVPDDERWPTAFRGLGVRIEDSIAVGDENPLILTTEAVKEVVDIEALRD